MAPILSRVLLLGILLIASHSSAWATESPSDMHAKCASRYQEALDSGGHWPLRHPNHTAVDPLSSAVSHAGTCDTADSFQCSLTTWLPKESSGSCGWFSGEQDPALLSNEGKRRCCYSVAVRPGNVGIHCVEACWTEEPTAAERKDDGALVGFFVDSPWLPWLVLAGVLPLVLATCGCCAFCYVRRRRVTAKIAAGQRADAFHAYTSSADASSFAPDKEGQAVPDSIAVAP